MTSPAAQQIRAFASLAKNPEAPEAKAALSRLVLQINAHYQSGTTSSVDFMAAAVEALKGVAGAAHAELRINGLIDSSHYFFLLGQTFRAIDPAISAVELARVAKHQPLLKKALTLLAIVYADSGNIARAIECYAEALELAHAMRDSEAECPVWLNLGVALLYAAQYHDAIACFEHTIHLAGNHPSLVRYRLSGFANIALCCLHLEDFSRGLKAADICVKESPEPHSAAELVSRVLKENYYTRLLLEVNDIENAGKRCAIARKYATDQSRHEPILPHPSQRDYTRSTPDGRMSAFLD